MSDGELLTDDEGLWSIGAVTRRTGLTDHTLRAWERRFGFPRPQRLPSGHRRYSSEDVQRLILIASALHAGHRASDVVPMEMDALRGLSVLLVPPPGAGDGSGAGFKPWVERVIHSATIFDGRRLQALLAAEATVLGARPFLRLRAAPLMVEVGDRWARGEIGVRHEHFVSDGLEFQLKHMVDILREAEVGPTVVLACLPGEGHSFGVSMVAVELAALGVAVRPLGRATPLDEIAQTAEAVDAVATAISVSLFAEPDAARRELDALAALVPDGMPIWVGGAGSTNLGPLPASMRVIDHLDGLDEALRAVSPSH
jgi:methylmalonyl-CoA mutase cobalamin-binding subunit